MTNLQITGELTSNIIMKHFLFFIVYEFRKL